MKDSSNCGSNQREIIAAVNEKVNIRESLTAILRRVDIRLRYLLATIAVTICVPLAFYFAGKADLLSTIIIVGAGGLAFYLGYSAFR